MSNSSKSNPIEENSSFISSFSLLRSLFPVISLLTLFKLSLALSAPNTLYKSTDFDVHRNWLAITRNLPVDEWYFDDQDGQTVHTLDYPPLFAFFEYVISSNPVTDILLNFGFLDDRCLDRLPDGGNDVSHECVVFQRITVILFDLMYVVAVAISVQRISFGRECYSRAVALLLLTNPGLIILDHIHFQYNATILSFLLLSVGFMVNEEYIFGAITYCLLVSMKHLYITLGPLYFIYLLYVFCSEHVGEGLQKPQFEWKTFGTRFAALAMATTTTLVVSFIPFLLKERNILEHLVQIKERLFPFARGLCHDYWAANVWAIYLFVDKIVRFLSRMLKFDSLSSLPEVPPSLCALMLLLAISPSFIFSWRYSRVEKSKRDKMFFVNALVSKVLTLMN